MLKLNFIQDTRENETVYEVRDANDPSAVSGFMNAFNIVINDAAQEKRYREMTEIEAPIYAVRDRRTKCGYRFIQY